MEDACLLCIIWYQAITSQAQLLASLVENLPKEGCKLERAN